jgi:predicted GNAT family N-acyltransferase
MDILNFYLEPASYHVDFADVKAVRSSVFVDEQGIPAELEFDALDPNCHHVIARDLQSKPIGTGRLSTEGKIGRMAVLAGWRRQRVGESLLRTLIEKALTIGLTQVTASAQITALGFYEKFGFTRYGEIFIEAGIPHQSIRLTLTPIDMLERPKNQPHETWVQAMQLDSLETTKTANLQLITAARRQLIIFSRDLEYSLYGQREVLDTLKQFVRRNNNSVMQIILQEPDRMQIKSHPLLELAQRLPSHFSIRVPLEEQHLQSDTAFICNDTHGYLFRPLGNRYIGDWSSHLPVRNRQLHDEFERVWQHSRPCTEFRALGL